MKKILIVEDEIIIGLDIASKLSKLGYNVIDTVTRPEEAVEAVRRGLPDLIIMDINLKSDTDGITLATQIRDEYEIPIIYLTSYSDQFMIERSMSTEPYGYIIKPYTDGALTATLKTCFTRMELENKIIDQKNMLGNIMNSITDAVAVVKHDGVIKAVNTRFDEITDGDASVGRFVEDVFDNAVTMDGVRRIFEDETKELFTVDIGGQNKHLLISASALEGEGGSIMLTITDLTEMYSMKSALFEAERRFTKIFRKKMVPAALVKAPDMCIFEINDSFAELYRLEEDYADRPVEDVLGTETLKAVRESMDEERNFRLDLERQIRKNGEEFYANIRGKIVEFDEHEYFLIDIYDVTEQVRISEIEKDLQQKLIHANKMTSLGTLVSGVAHEINNPNNFIMFNSSLLMEFWQDIREHLDRYSPEGVIGGMSVDEFCEDAEKLVTGIVKGSERIKNIVLDLKGFAKTESSEKFEKICPSEILNVSVRILEHQMSRATENFILDINEPLPYIYGNTQKLEQVLINIIMNAVEAVSSTSALIEIRCYGKEGKVFFEITDEGVGISEDAISRITEPFFTTKQSSGGTGLGLSIAYTIINEHGGTLDISSAPGKGTKVVITIPEYAGDEE